MKSVDSLDSSSNFHPTKEWYPKVELENLDPPIAATAESINAENPDQLLAKLRKKVETDQDSGVT